jgi:hypothetical protein
MRKKKQRKVVPLADYRRLQKSQELKRTEIQTRILDHVLSKAASDSFLLEILKYIEAKKRGRL